MIVWKRIFMLLFAFTLASFLATEVFAWTRGFHHGLGAPWFSAGVWPIYPPLTGWQWLWAWGWQAPEAFRSAGIVFGVVFGGLMLAMLRPRPAQKPQAQWATRRSLREAGMLGWRGVELGRWHGRILRDNGDAHTLMVAPTGSRKTTTVAMRTALTWRGSLFVHCPKDQIRPESQGWRSTFSRVVYLNPTDPLSDCYDPLQAIRLESPYEYRDTALVSGILANPEGEIATSATAQHFRDLTEVSLNGIILHGLYTNQATTLQELDQFFLSEASLKAIWQDMANTAHTAAGTHYAVKRSVHILERLDDRQLGGVLSNVSRALQMTVDPLVARMTSSSTFTLTDIREQRRPLTLYLTVPYSDQERLRPLSRLIVRQVLDYTTQHLDGWRHRLLMLIDEVQALKRMPALTSALTFVRGYGVKLCLITPSLSALGDEAQEYIENAHIRVIFAPNDPHIAERFSRMTGTEDVADRRRIGTTTEERLLSTTGVTYLPPDKGLLLIGNGGYPALITKAPYYRNWKLRQRSRRVRVR
jgi:type IV secretion system protein VirD4